MIGQEMEVLEGTVLSRRAFNHTTFIRLQDASDSVIQLVVSHPNEEYLSAISSACTVGSSLFVEGSREQSEEGLISIVVSPSIGTLEVRQCAPNPGAIDRMITLVSEGKFTDSHAMRALHTTQENIDELVSLKELPASLPRYKRLLSSYSRSLQGLPQKRQRNRKPKLKPDELSLLNDIEASQHTGFPRCIRCTSPQPPRHSFPQSVQDMIENLPGHDHEAPSARGPMSRGEYIHGRKLPQIEWMVSKIKEVIDARRDHGLKTHRILDVGGGRGDLSMAISRAIPNIHITVVDINIKSLEFGRAYRMPDNRSPPIEFVCTDFTKWVQMECAQSDFDLVVALHACGGLSDHALAFAAKMKLPFVICPCCFVKFPWKEENGLLRWCKLGGIDSVSQQTLLRLSESDNREISERSMRIVNSLRLQAVLASHKQGTWACELAAFDPAFSLRNYVLVGS